MNHFDEINLSTGFENGDKFGNENEVRCYFTVESQRDMFGRDAVTDQSQLSEWADMVIKNRWHMKAE